jgi:hypothetical protein
VTRGWAKGTKRSIATREKMAKAVNERFKDPEYRARHLEMTARITQDPDRNRKISEKLTGIKRSEEAIQNMKIAAKKRCADPEWIRKQKESHLDQTCSEETREKLKAAALKNAADPLYLKKVSDGVRRAYEDPNLRKRQAESRIGLTRSTHTKNKMSASALKRYNDHPEHATHMSEVQKRENNSCWRGGTSFLPYCYKFNPRRRKAVRNFFGNYCVICGKHVTENIIFWRDRYKQIALDVHHIHHDKEEGCNGKPFNLAPVCREDHGRENGDPEGFAAYITKTLEEGFKWGIWSREQYEIEVMYPE